MLLLIDGWMDVFFCDDADCLMVIGFMYYNEIIMILHIYINRLLPGHVTQVDDAHGADDGRPEPGLQAPSPLTDYYLCWHWHWH